MSTTIDALRNLGLKVNGTEPVSNYTGNIINEIADNYTGGGSGSGVYTFDYSAATATGDYSFSLAINQATMQELLAQPVIDLTLGRTVGNVFETSHITVTKGMSDAFIGSTYIGGDDNLYNVVFNLSSTAATLDLQIKEIPSSSGGGGTQLYKHTLLFTLEGEDIPIAIISTNNTTITNTSTFETVMEPAIASYAIGTSNNKQPILDWNLSLPSGTEVTLVISGSLVTVTDLVFVSDTVTAL